MRRLPIYVLVNTSSLINDDTLQSYNAGIKILIETLQENIHILKTGYVSIITFDNTITNIYPLSPLSSFTMPTLTTREHESSISEALVQLITIIDNNRLPITSNNIGDWKPLVFIFSDNDSVINVAKEMEDQLRSACEKVIVCSNNDSINIDRYKKISDIILPIDSFNKATILSLLQRILMSIEYASNLDIAHHLGLHPLSPLEIDCRQFYTKSSVTYEAIYPQSQSSSITSIDNLKLAYADITSRLDKEKKELDYVHSQITALEKKKDEIESNLENPSKESGSLIGTIVGAAVGACFSLFGGLVSLFGTTIAGPPTSASDDSKDKNQKLLLDCEKELYVEISKEEQCKKQIEELIYEKINIEKQILLEEQNKFDKVYSSIFAPAEVKRKSHLQVQVYLHLYEESEMVKSLSRESDKNSERRDYIPLSLKLKKGDKVDVEFSIYGETRLKSERKSLIWQGSFTKCSFDYFVPKDIDVDELSCDANLFVNGAMIGEMRFLTQIVDVPRNLNPEILSHRFNRIFISYAHQDAQQIKLLALAYKAQGVDYFYDRDSLAPGDVYEEKIFDYIDSSDLFVLCWSKNAAVSDYVAKEKGRALLRAYPQLSQRDATLKICPISIEPRADLPSDMKEVYNFEVI